MQVLINMTASIINLGLFIDIHCFSFKIKAWPPFATIKTIKVIAFLSFILQPFITHFFYLSLDLIVTSPFFIYHFFSAESDLYAMIAGGATTVATKGEVIGNVLSVGECATAAYSKG